MKLNKEPVAILAAAGSLVALLTAIGVLSPTVGGAIGAAVVAIGGLFVRGAVTPNVRVAQQVTAQSQQMVTEAAVQTAAGIDSQRAGPPGEVTVQALPVVTSVVQQVLNKPKAEATSLVDSVLGPRRPRGV
jgi:hypothetical protein